MTPIADDSTPIASPCLSICRMSEPLHWHERLDAELFTHHGASYCVGCARTIDEIAEWSALSNPERRAIWSQLPDRRYALREMDAPEAGV
jgi:uncharacterized protein